MCPSVESRHSCNVLLTYCSTSRENKGNFQVRFSELISINHCFNINCKAFISYSICVVRYLHFGSTLFLLFIVRFRILDSCQRIVFRWAEVIEQKSTLIPVHQIFRKILPFPFAADTLVNDFAFRPFFEMFTLTLLFCNIVLGQKTKQQLFTVEDFD